MTEQESTSNNILDDYIEKNPPVEPAELYKAYPLIGFDLWTDADMLPGEMCKRVEYDKSVFADGGSQAVYTAIIDAIGQYVAGKTCCDTDSTKPTFSIMLHFTDRAATVDYKVTDNDPAYERVFSVLLDNRFLTAFDSFVQFLTAFDSFVQ